MNDERIFAIASCQELLIRCSDLGFVIAKNGLKTSRTINKDLKQVIEAQITRHQEIIIHAWVSSRKIQKWYQAKYTQKKSGLISFFQLGYLTPRDNWMTWHIGISDIAKEQFLKEAFNLMDNYLIPLLDRFHNTETLINELSLNGGKFVDQKKDYWAAPFSFSLVYSDIEKTQKNV